MLCAGLGGAVISGVPMFTSDSKDLQIRRMNLYERHMTLANSWWLQAVRYHHVSACTP
jgi:hypothetical protein